MTSRFKVVITDFVTGPLEVEQNELGDLADVVALHAVDEKELLGQVDDADAIMTYHSLSLTKLTIGRLDRCKLIVRCGVGYDNVDWRFASERGIPVANVPDYGTEEVADSAIGLTLALVRGISALNSLLRLDSSVWTHEQVSPLRRLRGRTFGIVGLGRIGTATARRAASLGMEVAYYDPYKPDGYDKALGVRRVGSLAELLSCVHVLSIHCPLTPETYHLIDGEAIARMPFGSYLINTARGAVVNTEAIPDAIASGQIAGAGIDVLENEPPNLDDPLIRAWRDSSHLAYHRVLVNPHSAFYCEEGFTEMRIKGSAACRAALLGLPIRNVTNGVKALEMASSPGRISNTDNTDVSSKRRARR